MKVVCTQENLKEGLQVIARVVGNSTTLPILNNVMLETENGLLKISGTNLEIGMSTEVRCKVEKEGGICVGMKTFSDLINSLPNENITLTSEENQTRVQTSHTNTKIKHISTEEFPIIPQITDGGKVTLDAQEFKKSIDQVVYASSTSETQPEISGVLMWFGSEKVLLTATDRFRLAEKSLPYKGGIDLKVIVPHKSILEISRLLATISGEVSMNVTGTQLALTVGDTYSVTRLIDGEYPPYQQIIPDQSGTEVKLIKSELQSAIRTSSVFSSRTGSIGLNFDTDKNILSVNAVSHDLGESVIEVPCEIKGDSGSLTVNYRYILDFLNNYDQENITIKIIDDSNPVVFVSEDDNSYLYLVMPIKQ